MSEPCAVEVCRGCGESPVTLNSGGGHTIWGAVPDNCGPVECCGLPLEPWPGPCVTCGHEKNEHFTGILASFIGCLKCIRTIGGHESAPWHRYVEPKRCPVHPEQTEAPAR